MHKVKEKDFSEKCSLVSMIAGSQNHIKKQRMKQKDFESSRATDEAASEARIGPKKLGF